jgi:hypothetical protein
MSRVHKVATVQFEPTMFEKEPNIARLIELCRRPLCLSEIKLGHTDDEPKTSENVVQLRNFLGETVN